MALQPLSAQELADAPTLFASFMGSSDAGYRTVAELLAIYRERSPVLRACDDHADELRVERYIDDMAGARWTADVVLRVGEFDDSELLIDGIHRSMAYLACVQDGISAERLPALSVER